MCQQMSLSPQQYSASKLGHLAVWVLICKTCALGTSAQIVQERRTFVSAVRCLCKSVQGRFELTLSVTGPSHEMHSLEVPVEA